VQDFPVQRVVHRAVAFYENYFRNGKTFARTIPFVTGVTQDEQQSYVRHYLHELQQPDASRPVGG
jgi:hypothetical protein